MAGVLVSKHKEMLDQIKQEADWKTSNAVFKLKSMIRGFAYVVTKNTFVYKLFHYITIESKGKLQKTEHEKPSEEKTSLYQYRFAEWQAVILLKQLKRLEELFAKRKELYAFYDNFVNNPIVKKPPVDDNAVCCRYAIQVKNRNDFYKSCVRNGVDMDFSHCTLGCPTTFMVEHKMANSILNLPYYVDLKEREKKKIVQVVNSISFE